MNFKDKVVLVTGASRGIGRAVAIAFASKGANLALNYKGDDVSAGKTLSLLKQGKHELFKADISNPEEVRNLLEDVILKFGRLDILINNAGIAIHHPIEDMSYESWQDTWNKILKTNLLAIANLCHLASGQMIRQGGGRIVNVSSRGAFRGEPEQPAYGASKAGLNALSQSLAKQLAPYNIYINVVAPGFVDTDMANDFLSEEEMEVVKRDSPLNRIAAPEEVANAILFLASEESAFTTGAILDINGASYLRT